MKDGLGVCGWFVGCKIEVYIGVVLLFGGYGFCEFFA
jgi:hypothetical protein